MLPRRRDPSEARSRSSSGDTLVPAYDQWFDSFAQRWGEQNSLQVRVDHVPNLELPARYAAEVASQAGHDIIQFAATGGPNLFSRHLEDQDELMNRLDREQGGWESSARNLAFVDGHWKALPDFFLCPTICYRIDLFQQEGLEAPRTWNDLLVSGARLKPKGNPGGIGYVAGHPDANVASRAILWSFGGSYVAQDGKTVTLDSKETREALRFGKALLEEAMTEEVYSWDDTSNNKMLAAGRAGWIHNPISAYLTIQKENPELADRIGIAPTPMGPADRRTAASPNTFGIWRFSRTSRPPTASSRTTQTTGSRG